MKRFWQALQATTIVFCAFPGIVFPLILLVGDGLRSVRRAEDIFEISVMFDYFTMYALSPILVFVMWMVRWIWCKSFSPAAKRILTGIAVAGTLGTAFFWIRFFN